MRGADGNGAHLATVRVTSSAHALDPKRWAALWRRLGAEQDALPIFTRLEAAYAEPARAYHTAEHISDCLIQLDRSDSRVVRPDEVEAAIWFHDAVYQPGREDNEDRSADLARIALSASAVAPDSVSRIAELVLITRHERISEEPHAALLSDVDISILGRSPDEFNRFERQIRQEYARVPDSLYRSTRSAILRRLLIRPFIYQTAYFRNRYEAPARANIARLIDQLGAEGDARA